VTRSPDMRHRPYSLRPRAGRLLNSSRHAPKEPRARGTPGSRAHSSLRSMRKQKCSDPRTSTPHDIEACRNPVDSRKSAVLLASRARCLRFAPHRPRWTSHFRRPSSSARTPIHRCGPRSTAGKPVTGCRASPSRGPSGARTVRRDEAAWTADWGNCAASPTPPNRPPLPAPRLETLIRHPSVAGAGCVDNSPSRNIVKYPSPSSRASERSEGGPGPSIPGLSVS
jgi:hypothetical protein